MEQALLHALVPPPAMAMLHDLSSARSPPPLTYAFHPRNDFKLIQSTWVALPASSASTSSSPDRLFYTSLAGTPPKPATCVKAGPPSDFRADSSPEEEPENKDVTWIEDSFEANGIRIYYYKSQHQADAQDKSKIGLPLSLKSSSKPKLVFLHGLGAAGTVLQNLMSDLADQFEVILPTARGHGKSKPIPSGSFLMENLVKDAVAVIQHVSPDAPVYLGGHSMGASTAARVAASHPELVQALVLEDPPWLRLPSDPLQRKASKGGGGGGGLPPPLRMAKKLQEAPNDESPTKSGMVLAQRSLDVDALLPTFQQTDDAINEAVEGLQVPTLLQLGQKECGSVLDASLAETVVRGWSSAKVLVFENAGHVIHAGSNRSPWLSSVKEHFSDS